MTALALAVLVKASLIMAAAGAAALLSRRASAAKRHMLLAVSIVALLALPVLTAILPSLRVPVASSASVGRIAAAVEEIDTPRAIDPAQTIAASATSPDVSTSVVVAPVSPWPWGTILLAVYLAGVLVFSLKLLAENIAIRRLVRRSAAVSDSEWTDLADLCRREAGMSRSVRLLRSLDETMPMAFGVVKPSILLPSIADTWTDDRRRAVLLHELAHIARRDCLTQLVTRVACALYWPHPGAWLIARRLRMERELACDDRVLAIGTAAPDYAQHLLELAYSLGGYRAPALVVSMARPKQLEGRMLAVLDHARNRNTPAARFRVATFLAAGLIVMPLAAARIGAMPDAATYIAEKGALPTADLPSAAAAEQSKNAGQTYKRREIQLPGTWSIRPTNTPGIVSVQISERRNSNSSFDVELAELQGLTGASLSANGPVKFSIRRDAGTINFEGAIRSGVGAGTFDFTPSPAFAAEMAKRGYERPSDDDLYILARGNIGTAYLDEIASQKYARPSLDELLRAGDHGADLNYLRDMGRAGYHLGQIESLIRTRDHGVDRRFMDGLKAHGLTGLSVDDLVRARDHGVDPDYIAAMKNAGYDLRDINGLIKARDHGVDDRFVAGFIEAGYKNLTLDELIRLRDHGVSASWARRQTSGGSRMSVDELIRRRDRGGDN